jgi:hypothetical protein
LYLVGDLFELYDDARTYKPNIAKTNKLDAFNEEHEKLTEARDHT